MPPRVTGNEFQVDSGNAIFRRLFRDTGERIRFRNLHGFLSVAPSINVTILLLGTITRPHILHTLQPISSRGAGNDLAIDILTSSDTLVDVGAELRDSHLSGGRLATDGWPATTIATAWTLQLPQHSWFTVYKLAMRNANTGTTVFDVSLTLELF